MHAPITPHSLKEKQRKEREALILQAAEAVLAEKGYHEMSIDEIAARVGIAKGTVYLHFASKEELVLALVERDSQKLLNMILARTEREATARGKLETIFQTLYRAFFDQRMRMPYLLYNDDELRRLFHEKGCMQDNKEQIYMLIRSLLEEGKASGELDVTLPTPIMMSAFFGVLSPRSYERLLVDEQMAPDDIVQHFKRLYFKSITAIKEK